MTEPLMTRRDLDDGVCDDPDCDRDHEPLVFHSRCHPAAPTSTEYANGGELRIFCAECEATVTRIAVAG